MKNEKEAEENFMLAVILILVVSVYLAVWGLYERF